MIPNPWILLGITIAWVSSIAGTYIYAHGDGVDDERLVWTSAEMLKVKDDLKVNNILISETIPIIAKRDADSVKERIVYRTIKEKVNALPSDNVCFTADSLHLWNQAIIGASKDSDRPKPIDEAGRDNTATVKEVLTNASSNFETCKQNSIKHNALIDKVESLTGKMCVCSE